MFCDTFYDIFYVKFAQSRNRANVFMLSLATLKKTGHGDKTFCYSATSPTSDDVIFFDRKVLKRNSR